jgi:hypothetical protein
MRYAVKAMLLALACVVAASAAQAADWAWTLIEPGSDVLVRGGTAEVERTRNRVTAVLRERGRDHSTLSAQLRDGRLSGGSVIVSHTDGGPIGLSQGRWLVHKMSPRESIETIWLLAPRSGHYLVITRLNRH